MRFTADFETTTKAPARVWLWALVGIDQENEETGEDIESFFDYIEKQTKNPVIYFHNLKFDGYFILDFLLRSGFEWRETAKECSDKMFTSIIDGFNEFYQIVVYFKRKNGNVKSVTFWDSQKLLHIPVADIPRKFGFENLEKGKIDYDRHNVPCFVLPEEREYCMTDARIMAKAMRVILAEGCDHMTISLCALADYKRMIGKRNFSKWFPVLPYEVDCEMRQALRGGWCYANPRYIGREVSCGFVFDQNSKYGKIMHDAPLPFGDPVKFAGKYPDAPEYPLYIQHLRCMFRLKSGKLPFIQIKRNPEYMPTEYVRDSENIVDLWLCSPEIPLFFEQYEVTNIEYIDGYMFKSSTKLFCKYIEKWDEIKESAEISGNKGLRLLAKSMIVSLYGKFSKNPERRTCRPELNPDADQIALHLCLYPCTDAEGHIIFDEYENDFGEIEEVQRLTDTKIIDAGYIPTACFVTSWGRYEEVTAAQRLHDETLDENGDSAFLYGDTDSLHCLLDYVPDFLDIDPARLGAWKVENYILRARYLQSKRYIMEVQKTNGERELKCVCAGMPNDIKKGVTYDDFSLGAVYYGRKLPVIVPGGVILKEVPFCLN